MSNFVSPDNIQFRIRRNQSRASTVGITYWLATIVLFVLSIFPYVGNMTGYAEDGHLWVVSFISPLLALGNGTLTGDVLLNAVASILYALLLVFTIGNFTIATTRLFRITKKNPTNKLGYNRASKGTKTMGKAYARMFFWLVTVAVSALLLTDGSFTLFFYIAFVFALIFHFVCNFSACKISYFQTTDDRFRPIERIRTEGRAICLLRNAWQFFSIALIVIFMDKFGLTLGSLFDIADANQSATIFANHLLDGVVLPAVLFLVLVCLVVCIRHATATTEYNEYGTKGRGMKTCRIFATAIAVLSIVGELVVLIAPEGAGVPKWAFLAIFAVATQWVVAENMFFELSKKKEELEAEELAYLEELEKQKQEKEDKLAKNAQKTESAPLLKTQKKDKKAEKKRLKKERLARILDDSDEYVSPLDEEPVDGLTDVTAETDEQVVATQVSEDAQTTATEETQASLESVQVVEESKETVEQTEFESFVAQAKKLKNPSKDQVERVALKKKWMAMASQKDEEERKVNLDGKKLVYCPCCNQKLSVKLTTEVALCPTCKTKFRVRKVQETVSDFRPNESEFVWDMQASQERLKEMQVELDAQYLAEAEEELRRLLESDEI